MKDFALYKTIFSLPSIRSDSAKEELVIFHRLSELLRYRLTGREEAFSTDNYIRNALSYGVEYDLEKPLIKWLEEHKETWEHSSQYFGCECDPQEINQSGLVTWDCEPFFLLCNALMYQDLQKIGKAELEEVYTSFYEYTEDWEEENMKENMENYLEELFSDLNILKAIESTGKMPEEDSNIVDLIDDFCSICFGEMVSLNTFLAHLSTMLSYIGLVGVEREVFVLRSKWAAAYIKNRERIPSSPEKELVEQSIEVLSCPLDEDWQGLSGFTSLEGEHQEWFTSVFFLGSLTNGECLRLSHVKPGLLLAMETIENLVPTILTTIEENSVPSAA